MQRIVLLALVAVATAGWVDLYKFPWTGTPLQFMFAVQCPNTTMCLLAGGESNTAEGVYFTTDDFQSVQRAQMDATGLILLDLRMGSATHGVAGGVGAVKAPGIIYTSNSYEWKSSDDLLLIAAQSMERESAEKFYMIGSINSLTGASGVSVSATGGYLWENKAWPSSITNQLPGNKTCGARYGAFVGSTWYISAGSFPGNNSDNVHWISARHGVDKLTKKIVKKDMLHATKQGPADNNGYTAAIVKTTDAGSTWEVMYKSQDDFYFNDIECSDENTCIAAAEGFSQDGSTNPGARIMMTTDGGKTWSVSWQGQDGTSVLRMKCLDANNCWAGTSSLATRAATFYSTSDGGKTWTAGDTLKGVEEVLSIDFVSSSLGYATGITEASVCTPMKYTA